MKNRKNNYQLLLEMNEWMPNSQEIHDAYFEAMENDEIEVAKKLLLENCNKEYLSNNGCKNIEELIDYVIENY